MRSVRRFVSIAAAAPVSNRESTQNKKNESWRQSEENKFNKLLHLAMDSANQYNWTEVADDEESLSSVKHWYTLHAIEENKDPIQFVRSECIISDFHPDEYSNFLADPRNFCIWEVENVEACTKTEVLKIVDEDHSVLYGVYRAIQGSFYAYFNIVSPRDFQYVMVRKYLNDGQMCVNFMYSIDKHHELYVDGGEDPKCVRSEFMGMYIVERIDNDESRIVTILCGNAKGWIPYWLNNQMSLHTVLLIGKFVSSIPWMKSVLQSVRERRT